MPRYAQVEKSIHGQPVSQTEFLKAIARAINKHPDGARLADILPDLGPEWDTPERKKLLATTLANMLNRGTIAQVDDERGLYCLSNFARRNGVNDFDSVEQSILAVIREHGGFCRFRDIMIAHNLNPVGEDADIVRIDPAYKRVLDVISRSQLIRQDAAERGVYNLPWPEVANLPLLGRWAALLLKTTWEENRERDENNDYVDRDRTSWWKWRDNHYFNVGQAAKLLREAKGWSVDDLLAKKKVYAALAELERKAPVEVNIIRQDVFDRTSVKVAEMKEAGASQDEIDAFKEARLAELNHRQLEWLYKRFERGSTGAHYHAPLVLYNALAEAYGACPAALSRGVPSFLPYADRIRPERTRRHAIDIDEERDAIQADIDRQTRMIEEWRRQEAEGDAYDAEMSASETD